MICRGAKEFINVGRRPVAHVTKFANAVGGSVPAGGMCPTVPAQYSTSS